MKLPKTKAEWDAVKCTNEDCDIALAAMRYLTGAEPYAPAVASFARIVAVARAYERSQHKC